MRKRTLVVAALAVLGLLTIAVPGSSAHDGSTSGSSTTARRADLSYKHYTYPFNFPGQSYYSKVHSVCAHSSFSGTLSYDVGTDVYDDGPHYLYYRNVGLSNPDMLITVTENCGRTASTVKVRKLTASVSIKATVSNYNDCSLNPSYSVSFPFSVSLGVTPDCKQKKAPGVRAQASASNAYMNRLYLSNRVIYVPKVFSTKVNEFCFRVQPAAAIMRGTGLVQTDSHTFDTQSICFDGKTLTTP